MENTRKIFDDIIWVGASDRRVTMFENLFPLTNGMSYNSFVIVDEKTALMDTVDSAISDVYLQNVEHALNGRDLDYLVIHHMEPDHCANIEAIVARYPNVKLVGNKSTFKFFEQFYFMNAQDNYLLVKENDEINLGKRTLQFMMTPSVHWPEVMMSVEVTDGILFSADAFGTFAPLDGNLFTDELDYKVRVAEEARRYYSNIVGKFGNNVIRAIQKVSKHEIKMICPLHGPIYRSPEDIAYILDRYNTWATYAPEQESVLIVFGSMYGNTENAVDILASRLAQKGIRNIKMYDVSNVDPSYIVSDIWSYSNIVFASPNYNGDIFYKVDNLIKEVIRLNFKNRKISFMANFTWGGNALKSMQEYFTDESRFTIVGDPVEIRSSVKEINEDEIEALAVSIAGSIQHETVNA